MVVNLMSKVSKPKEHTVITTKDLKNVMFKERKIPTPAYQYNKEYGFIVQTRGTIFSEKNITRNKSPKF